MVSESESTVLQWLLQYSCKHKHKAAILFIKKRLCALDATLTVESNVRLASSMLYFMVNDREVSSYDAAISVTELLFSRSTQAFSSTKVANLVMALKIKYMLHLLMTDQADCLQKLNQYFPRTPPAICEYLPKRVKEKFCENMAKFRKFFLSIMMNDSYRKSFIEEEYERDFGEAYEGGLWDYVIWFTNVIDSNLPTTKIERILSLPLATSDHAHHSVAIELLLDFCHGHHELTSSDIVELASTLCPDEPQNHDKNFLLTLGEDSLYESTASAVGVSSKVLSPCSVVQEIDEYQNRVVQVDRNTQLDLSSCQDGVIASGSESTRQQSGSEGRRMRRECNSHHVAPIKCVCGSEVDNESESELVCYEDSDNVICVSEDVDACVHDKNVNLGWVGERSSRKRRRIDGSAVGRLKKYRKVYCGKPGQGANSLDGHTVKGGNHCRQRRESIDEWDVESVIVGDNDYQNGVREGEEIGDNVEHEILEDDPPVHPRRIEQNAERDVNADADCSEFAICGRGMLDAKERRKGQGQSRDRKAEDRVWVDRIDGTSQIGVSEVHDEDRNASTMLDHDWSSAKGGGNCRDDYIIKNAANNDDDDDSSVTSDPMKRMITTLNLVRRTGENSECRSILAEHPSGESDDNASNNGSFVTCDDLSCVTDNDEEMSQDDSFHSCPTQKNLDRRRWLKHRIMKIFS